MTGNDAIETEFHSPVRRELPAPSTWIRDTPATGARRLWAVEVVQAVMLLTRTTTTRTRMMGQAG
jgi:hypothetical protein